MFTRIVVGTDGSETAPRRCARPPSWPSSPAPRSTSSAPTSRSQRQRSQEEQRDAPADVQYEIGPREDVNLVLDAAAADGQAGGGRGPDPPGRGRPRRRDPQRRRGDQGRPDRGRQQGDDRRAPLPARQRPQQGLPSRSLQRDHRPHDLAGSRACWRSARGRRAPASISPAPCSGRVPAAPRSRAVCLAGAVTASTWRAASGLRGRGRRWRGPSRRRRRRGRRPSRCRRSCRASPKRLRCCRLAGSPGRSAARRPTGSRRRRRRRPGATRSISSPASE